MVLGDQSQGYGTGFKNIPKIFLLDSQIAFQLFFRGDVHEKSREMQAGIQTLGFSPGFKPKQNTTGKE